MQKACFITLEGVDGAGKSTHFEWLNETLRRQNIDLICTREPGGTELGEALRELLLHQSMQLKTEILLMFAARNEHWEQKIKPALAMNKWVLCDRFTDSTYAYQGGGRQMGAKTVALLDEWLNMHANPDFTFLFDLSLAVARSRLDKNRTNSDRFEKEGGDFFERTRQAYLDRMQAESNRFKLLNAENSIVSIQQEMLISLQSLFATYTDRELDINKC